MAGKLYVVGTPIGNLGDFSPRAAETLRQVDFLAVEDTRVTIKILNHFGIQKPMVRYHAHIMREQGEKIVGRILMGESAAILTDAGMPCISDPGEDLVVLCQERGVEIESVPGPSALITALALSGQSTSRFSFEGFLSVTTAQRRAHLAEIRAYPHTMIFYEAPHKLKRTLRDLLETLGDRSLSIARELTKLHEEVWKTTLSEALAHYRAAEPKGEYVLVVAGYCEEAAAALPVEIAVEQVLLKKEEGLSLSAAAKEVAAQTGMPKSALYKAALFKEKE